MPQRGGKGGLSEPERLRKDRAPGKSNKLQIGADLLNHLRGAAKKDGSVATIVF